MNKYEITAEFKPNSLKLIEAIGEIRKENNEFWFWFEKEDEEVSANTLTEIKKEMRKMALKLAIKNLRFSRGNFKDVINEKNYKIIIKLIEEN